MKTFLMAGLLALLATMAAAHTGLNATVPEDGAILTEVPPHVVLTFGSDTRLVRVRMTHDDHSAIDLDLGDRTAFGTRFIVPLADFGTGLYRIELRSLAHDGHAMREVFMFRVQ